jgi:hypothetical protein
LWPLFAIAAMLAIGLLVRSLFGLAATLLTHRQPIDADRKRAV